MRLARDNDNYDNDTHERETVAECIDSGEPPATPAPSAKRTKRKRNTHGVGSWNLRTCAWKGEVTRSGNIRIEGEGFEKLPHFLAELERYSVGICAFQEHRWLGHGTRRATSQVDENSWTILYSGKDKGHLKLGVGLALDQHWTSAWRAAGMCADFVSARLLRARFFLHGRMISIISIYAPTDRSDEREHDDFWTDLDSAVKASPQSDLLVVLGDFNARLGRGAEGDKVLGPFGPQQPTNLRGERVHDFCQEHRLLISHSFFPWATRGTWQYARSKRWYALDMCLIRQRDRRILHECKPLIPPECETDHRLLRTKLYIRKLPRQRIPDDPLKRKPRLDFTRNRHWLTGVVDCSGDQFASVECVDSFQSDFQRRMGRSDMPTEAPPPTTYLYTDGSAKGKKADASGGWAFVVVTPAGGVEVEFGPLVVDGAVVCAITNQTAELVAVRQALSWALAAEAAVKPSAVVIRSDSQYTINLLLRKSTPRCHVALVHECRSLLDRLKSVIPVSLLHVFAHTGDRFNEIADQHANSGRRGCHHRLRRVSPTSPSPTPLIPQSSKVKANPASIPSSTEQWAEELYQAGLQAFGTQPVCSFRDRWKQAYKEEIHELAESKRTAYWQHLQTPHDIARRNAYKSAVKVQRKRMREMLNEWWQKTVDELAQKLHTRTGSHFKPEIFKALENLGKVFWAPTVNTTLYAADGETKLDSASDRRQRWTDHFRTVLNNSSQTDSKCILHLEQRPVAKSLDDPITLNELSAAIGRLVNNKAPGEDGVQAELLKMLPAEEVRELLLLFNHVWGKPPACWRDAIIVAVHKGKKSKTQCDHYRGISLLNVIGKLFARIAAKRLSDWAEREDILPESQHGFRPDRSTLDAILSTRLAAENCLEAGQPLFLAFVDLAKAFDSIDRSTLYSVLARLGIPEGLLASVRELHDGMQASVWSEGALGPEFPVSTGVRQGCCLAPILFNIFYGQVIRDYSRRFPGGITFNSRIDGQLKRRFTGSRHQDELRHVQTVNLHTLEFADDLVLFAESFPHLQQQLLDLHHTMRDWGLHMSDKTETMGFNADVIPIQITDSLTVGPAGPTDEKKGGLHAGLGNSPHLAVQFLTTSL